ncbi:hypothetical protein RSAG8_01936, partial [Rhizoctonia solani AG-8 WAC10335]
MLGSSSVVNRIFSMMGNIDSSITWQTLWVASILCHFSSLLLFRRAEAFNIARSDY